MTGERNLPRTISGEPGERHEQSKRVECSPLISGLPGVEFYDPAAPATAYLQERVAVFCGDDYATPDVYIMKNNEIDEEAAVNALSVGKALVFNDTIFDALEYTEELDGVISHELQHFVRGHACRRGAYNSDLLASAGSRRAGEIEADTLGMWRMDERGINPLGMISLADKMARLEAPGATDRRKRPHLSSPAHGDTLGRKITLEQLLTVIDARHLSPHLQPLQKPELGNIVSPGDEAFWRLPIAAQQNLLNSAVKRHYPRQTCINIQKRLLQTVTAETEYAGEDDVITERKALLILGFQALPEHLANAADPESLRRDLELLDAPDVAQLMPVTHREFRGWQLAMSHVRAELANPSDDTHAIAEVGRVVGELHPWLTPESQGLYTRLESIIPIKKVEHWEQTLEDQIVRKLAHYEATAGVRPLPPSARGQDGTPSMPMPVSQLPESDRRLANIRLKIEMLANNYGLQELETYTSALDKLMYISKIGDGRNFFYPGSIDKTLIGSPFYLRLQNELQQLGTSDLIDQVLTLAANGAPSNLVQKVATNALDFLTFDNKKPNLSGAVLEELDQRGLTEKQWEELLPLTLMSMTGSSMKASFHFSDIVTPDNPDAAPSETIRTIVSRVQKLHQAAETLAANYPDLIDIDITSLVRTDLNSEIRQALLHNGLSRYVTKRSDNGRALVALMQNYGVSRLEQGQLYPTKKELTAAIGKWSAAVDRLLSQPDWHDDEHSLMMLAALGMAAPEIEVNLAVPEFAFRRLARMRDFEGGLALLHSFPHTSAAQSAILEILIEEKARTPEDFERLQTAIEERYLKALADNMGVLGATSLADGIAIPLYSSMKEKERVSGIKIDTVRGLESSRLLQAILSSGHSDSKLKSYMAERWWLGKRTQLLGDLADHFTAEDYIVFRHPHKAGQLDFWLKHNYPPAHAYPPFDDNLSSVYLLTDAARFYAVRKLLLGREDGALMERHGSEALVDALMQTWLSAEAGSAEGDALRTLLLNLLVSNDAATSYIHIGPMLQDLILKPPKETSDLTDATRAIAHQVIDSLVAKGLIPADEATNRTKSPAVNDTDYANMHARVHRLFTGGQQQMPASAELVQATKEQLLAATDSVSVDAETTKLSTIAFAALVGKKAGSLGVKMLQLARQYFDLSPEDLQEFEGIFDDMKGQSRLQAYNTLKREAEYNPNVAALFQGIRELGPRVGGGSLFTVYKAYMKDGSEMAIGIKNPNAEYRISRLAEFASVGLKDTIAQYPENTTLQLMSSLLDDACAWVRNELDDPEFPQKDATFKRENDTLTGSGFSKGNSRYELVTPEAFYTDSGWVRSERFVDGKNLSQLTVVDDRPTDISTGIVHRDDFKHIASTIVRDYVHQVLGGTEAHSDIHPGNFRVSTDNSRIWIFDRHNLLTMHDKLRQTLRTAFGSILTGDLQGAALAVALHAAPAGSDSASYKAMVEEVAARSPEPGQLVTGMILSLKQQGIKVPLDLSLLLRNFMSVAQLSQQAGFTNLAEAFLHTSAGLDELMHLITAQPQQP